jgi:hypothetical protein
MMTGIERASEGAGEEERRRTTMTAVVVVVVVVVELIGTDYQKQVYPLESLQEVT